MDIPIAHNISTSTVYQYKDDTMKIDKTFYMTSPYLNASWINIVSMDLSKGSRSALHVCCGALYRLFVKILELKGSEVPNSSSRCK